MSTAQGSESGGLLLDVRVAAALLDVSPRRVYAWVSTGHIPAVAVRRMGRAVYIVRPVLEAWLCGRRDGTAASPGRRLRCPDAALWTRKSGLRPTNSSASPRARTP